MKKQVICLTSLLLLLLIASAATSVVKSEDNNQIKYELRITMAGCGGVSPDEGTYSYENGTEVSVLAMDIFSADGSFFSYWLLDGTPITNNNPISLTMNQDHDLLAVFKGTPSVHHTTETTPTPTPSPTPTPTPTPTLPPTPTPSPTSSPTPSPSPTPFPSQKPFPTTTSATISGASAAIIGIGLTVYFKKRKH